MYTRPDRSASDLPRAAADLVARVRSDFDVSLEEIVADLTWPTPVRSPRREAAH